MNSAQIKRRLSGAALALAVMFVIGVTGFTAQAQYHDYGRTQGGYGGDIYRMAQETGYRDGINHGQEHRAQGHRYDYADTRHYKDATNGYRSGYGNKDSYKQAYRGAFRRGYEEGYRGYNGGAGYEPYYRNDPYYRGGGSHDEHDRYEHGSYGGYGRYEGYGSNVSRIAYDQGYRDGNQHGEEHRYEGHRYDHSDARHYKDATNGYRSSYGSRDTYKQAYREGFRRGYDQGYRQGGGYYDNRSRPRSRLPWPF